MYKMYFALLGAVILHVPTVFGEGLLDDTDVFGRSTSSIILSLAERDIDADRVEAWGGSIRVFVRGSNSLLLVDKDTLKPIEATAQPLAVEPTREDASRGEFDGGNGSIYGPQGD